MTACRGEVTASCQVSAARGWRIDPRGGIHYQAGRALIASCVEGRDPSATFDSALLTAGAGFQNEADNEITGCARIANLLFCRRMQEGPKVVTVTSTRGPVLVSADLHGNLADFERLRDRFLESDARGEQPVWISVGDWVHGPPGEAARADVLDRLGAPLYAYRDETPALLQQLFALMDRFGDRVLSICGNHEHAHIGGRRTSLVRRPAGSRTCVRYPDKGTLQHPDIRRAQAGKHLAARWRVSLHQLVSGRLYIVLQPSKQRQLPPVKARSWPGAPTRSIAGLLATRALRLALDRGRV